MVKRRLLGWVPTRGVAPAAQPGAMYCGRKSHGVKQLIDCIARAHTHSECEAALHASTWIALRAHNVGRVAGAKQSFAAGAFPCSAWEQGGS